MDIMGDFAFWLNKMARLKVDRARGNPAPHKPLLLLVILDLAERGELPSTILPLSPELAFRFFTYWSIVAHRRSQRPDVRLPFHHLQTDGLWSALDEAGNSSPHRSLTRFVRMPSDFRQFAADPGSRDQARRVLINTYFTAAERTALCEAIGLPTIGRTGLELTEPAGPSRVAAVAAGREARFRLTVICAYDYACALSGHSLTTITAESIVEAAHVHEFADSRNNDPTNGIALCKNAHWSFDLGLWTVADDYSILVATDKFTEQSPNGRALKQYHGERLRVPADARFWPNPLHLAWHRRKKFLGT
jgi:putative restriction endonuclease